MLRIHCPLCGERPYTEYRYGGDADKRRPLHGISGASGASDAAAWHDYLFLFDNPKGAHREFWQHVQGCRQWLVVVRDTATNMVAEVMPAGDALRQRRTESADDR